MFYGKRTASLIAAVISIAILSLPVAATTGETDMAAGGGVENVYVQTGTANTPAESSGETDSHADEQNNQSLTQERLVYIDGIGETDQSAGGVVENEYVQTGILATAAISSGETDSYAIDQTVVSPTHERLVFIDGMGETDRHAGDRVENEYVQTGTLAVASNSSGETDSYAIDQTVGSPTQERLVYIDGMGETDQSAGGVVENEYVQTGILATAAISSGETDSYAVEQDASAPVQESIVYIDGMGETDQSAGGVVSSFRLTRSDIAHVDSVMGDGSEDRLVFVEAGETDQSAGIGTVEVPVSSGLVYVLLREAVPAPDKT